MNDPKFNSKHQGERDVHTTASLNQCIRGRKDEVNKTTRGQVPALLECFSFHLFWHSADTARKDYNAKFSFQDVILVTGTEKRTSAFLDFTQLMGVLGS